MDVARTIHASRARSKSQPRSLLALNTQLSTLIRLDRRHLLLQLILADLFLPPPAREHPPDRFTAKRVTLDVCDHWLAPFWLSTLDSRPSTRSWRRSSIFFSNPGKLIRHSFASAARFCLPRRDASPSRNL